MSRGGGVWHKWCFYSFYSTCVLELETTSAKNTCSLWSGEPDVIFDRGAELGRGIGFLPIHGIKSPVNHGIRSLVAATKELHLHSIKKTKASIFMRTAYLVYNLFYFRNM